jgi:hypothetical protein
MPQHPLDIPLGTKPGKPITTSTGTQVKTGGGVFLGFSVLAGSSGWVATVYDGTSTSGKMIAVTSLSDAGPVEYTPIRFLNGLFIETVGTAPGSVVPAYF